MATLRLELSSSRFRDSRDARVSRGAPPAGRCTAVPHSAQWKQGTKNKQFVLSRGQAVSTARRFSRGGTSSSSSPLPVAARLLQTFFRSGAVSLTSRLKPAANVVVIAGVAVLIGWMFNRTFVRTAELDCANNMRSIGLALDNYYSTYNHYPSPDFGGHSWRIRCLPFVLASAMYSEYRFDEPWDSTSNLFLDSRPLPNKKSVDASGEIPMAVHGMPYAFSCEYHSDNHFSSYLMLVGEDAFGKPDGWRTLDEIVDGVDSTVAVAETLRTDVHWLSPNDLDTRSMSFTVNDGQNSISSSHPRGPAVLFCDGTVYRLNPAIDPDTLKALITINGREDVSRDRLVARGFLLPP